MENEKNEWDDLLVAGTPEAEFAVLMCSNSADSRQWRIGDYALRFYPMRNGPGRPPQHAKLDLEKNLGWFAEKMDMEYSTVNTIRKVVAAYKMVAPATNTSFAAHKALMTYPFLIRDNMSVQQAAKAKKDEDARLEAEAKARAEREAEEARIRAEEAARLKAESEAAQVEEAERLAREKAVRENERVVEAEYQRGLADLLNDLSNIVYRYNEMAKTVRDLSQPLREADAATAKDYLRKIENKHTMFFEMLSTVDMDTELAKILNEG